VPELRVCEFGGVGDVVGPAIEPLDFVFAGAGFGVLPGYVLIARTRLSRDLFQATRKLPAATTLAASDGEEKLAPSGADLQGR